MSAAGGRLRIGVTYPQDELSGDPRALHRFAVAAEDLGYDHVLMYDHPVASVRGVPRRFATPARGYGEHDPFLDPLVAFGYLAGVTERIGLVTGVLVLPQRQTALVARQAADVQSLSEGRLALGVGIGYNRVEYETLGQTWATRGRRLDEQIGLLRTFWQGEPFVFDGEFDQVDRAGICPAPATPIPVLVGGASEAAFRRAARLADGFVFGYGMRPEALDAWRRVQELLAEGGRSTEGFRAWFNLLPDATGSWLPAMVEAIPRLERAGATHVAITSARQGLASVDEHIDFIATARAHLDRFVGGGAP